MKAIALGGSYLAQHTDQNICTSTERVLTVNSLFDLLNHS